VTVRLGSTFFCCPVLDAGREEVRSRPRNPRTRRERLGVWSGRVGLTLARRECQWIRRMGTRACPHGSALAAGVAVRLGSIFTRCPVLGARRGEERNRPRNPRVRRWRARRWRVGDRGVCSRGETGRRRGRPRVARVRGGGGGAVGGRGEGSRASATGGLAINKLTVLYIYHRKKKKYRVRTSKNCISSSYFVFSYVLYGILYFRTAF
jgi:hypothetical protein